MKPPILLRTLLIMILGTTLLSCASVSSPGPIQPEPTEKVLRLNNQVEPATVDPQKILFSHEVAFGSLNYEALLELNEQNEPIPAAAEAVEISPNGLTYTVTVRAGLKYSDGTPLTAHNFEYAFRRLLDPTLSGRSSASLAYPIAGAQELSEFLDIEDTARLTQLQQALGIRTIGDNTLIFTLKAPTAFFPLVLASWVGWPTREDLVAAGGPNWTSDENGKYYIGNGPFVLRQWNHGNSTIWETNPNYRKGRPNIDRIELLQIGDFTLALQGYKNGELDVVSLAPDEQKEVKSDPVLQKEFIGFPEATGYLALNTQKAPFDNIKVRQAFARAFDRNDFVLVVLNGAGQEATSFIPPGNPGYDANVKQADFDPEEARAMLADAGYPNGQGLPLIKLSHPARPYDKTVAEWVQNQLKSNLGIDVQLDPVEATAFNALLTEQETAPQIWFSGWGQQYPDPSSWLSVVFRSDATAIPTGWKSDEFDELTKAADIEQDNATRLRLYSEAQQIVMDEVPIIVLNWYVNGYLVKPYVVGAMEHAHPYDPVMPGFKNIVNIDITK